jgi:hypothetical protein
MVWLGRHPNHPLIQYQQINDEINVGRIVHYICGHIVFWFDPEWRPPYKTSAQAVQKFWDYEDIIRDKLIPEPEYTDDDLKNDQLDWDRLQKAEQFMVVLRTTVRKKFHEWNRIKQNVRQELTHVNSIH